MTDKKEAILEFQKETWAFWTPVGMEDPPCLLCWGVAVCLHEIVPRSLYPEWYEDTMNSIPVCDFCHQSCHKGGAAMRPGLQKMAQDRATDMNLLDRYLDWDLENPERVSKGAKPKMSVSGRSVFTIIQTLKKRRDK